MSGPTPPRRVWITGASRGIGAATARHLAAQGAFVVLAARSADAIEAIAHEIREAGGQAEAIACDVARYDDVKAAVAAAMAPTGRLDLLVNNAGVIEPVARLTDSNPADWAKVVDINLMGVYHGLRAALPAMTEAGQGTIVNISSGAAVGALEGWSQYCSSKAAALSLTRCADKEFGEKGLRVIGLSPGTVATQMQVDIKASGINPVSQLDWSAHIPPEWAGRAVVWLCSDAAADVRGDDLKLRDEDVRRTIGLID